MSETPTNTGGAGPNSRPARILVVDDSAVVRKVVSKLLRSKGYQVVTEDSGEGAFERILDESFDLIVTDVIMGALSGIQLCRLVRNAPETESLPVILLTAAYDPRSRFWGSHSGADACIAKEAMTTMLVPEIKRLLGDAPLEALRPSLQPPGNRPKPLERLSQVLDQLLFQTVVAGEVRRLINPGDDRESFGRSLVSLATEITDYAYLVLHLEGADGPTWTVHARGPWPRKLADGALSALGVRDAAPERVTVIREHDADHPETVEIQSGEMAFFPIESQGERHGHISIFGGHKRIGSADRSTFQLLASELGFVTHSLFLMEQTHRMAHTDALTDLHNRRRCNEYLRHEVERSKRYGTPLSIVIADVDNFKSINDEYGHAAGDDVLKVVAEVLVDGARSTDVVGRWGGEEFLIILPNTEPEGAQIAAERFRSMMESRAFEPKQIGQVTFSAGVAFFDGKESPEAFIDRADQALYRAKEAGKNRVLFAERL